MRLGEPRMMQGQSIIILKEGRSRDRGKGAQFSNIAAARAVADAVRSTLGPRGMDKMLVDSLGDVTITNDGVTILKEIEVEHPAAKMIVEVAKTQDQEAGDGTTTAVILAGELLKEAESLLEANVHPTTIAKGYQLAADQAIEILKDIAFPVKPGDKEILTQIATTAMGGRAIGDARSYLADLVVRAILAVTDEVAGARVADVENVKVEKKHGHQITDTQLIDGLVLDKERVHPRMPARIEDAKIALINRALEVKKTEVSEEIKIRDPSKLSAFLQEEERTLKGYVDVIQKAGANVVVCQKGIDDLTQHYLAKAGIYAVRRAKESDMEALSRATGERGHRSLHAPPRRRLPPGRPGAARDRGVREGARGRAVDPRGERGAQHDRHDHRPEGGPRGQEGRLRRDRRLQGEARGHAEGGRHRAPPREGTSDQVRDGSGGDDPPHRRRDRVPSLRGRQGRRRPRARRDAPGHGRGGGHGRHGGVRALTPPRERTRTFPGTPPSRTA